MLHFMHLWLAFVIFIDKLKKHEQLVLRRGNTKRESEAVKQTSYMCPPTHQLTDQLKERRKQDIGLLGKQINPPVTVNMYIQE